MTRAPQPIQAPAKNPPPGWGEDDLSKFLQAAHENQWAAFVRKPSAIRKLIAIDAQFGTASKTLQGRRNAIEAMLLIRCHAAFRTAAGLAMAGQAAESHPQCRAMLEYAAYAVHIYRNPSLGEVWLNRHQGVAGLKASKKAFQHVAIVKSVTAANRDAAKRFEDLYQHTIDFGGHPNERSVTGNMKMIKEPDRLTMLAVMQHGDGVEFDMALKFAAQCGMVSLELLQVIYNAKFELLGINAKLLALRKGL
jgi:hypothetical protein